MSASFSPSDLKAIMHSKRDNIYYLEKCRVMPKDGRILYLAKGKKEMQFLPDLRALTFFNPHNGQSFK